MRSILLVSSLIFGALGAGCTDNPTALGRAPQSAITVSPAVDTLRGIGAIVQLTASVGGRTATGPAASISWTSLNGGVATVDSLGTVRSVAAGTALIAAAWSGQADTATVVVMSPCMLMQLIVAPPSIVLAPGDSGQFSVAGTWCDGTPTVPPVTYSATGGTITAGGLYTAGTTPGTFQVVATQQGGPKADTSTVTITLSPPTLTQLVLTPASVTLAPGGTSQFAVSGTWSDGSSTVPAVTYAATGGTITAGGLYTAGTTAGTFQVIATQQDGSKADTSTVTIGVSLPTLTQLVLTPASVTLAPGGTSQFAVSGIWSDGSSTVPAVTYSATGGTITAGGLYTAGTTAGAFRVVAIQQGGSEADTSTVTIAVPPPQGVRYVSTSGNDANAGTQAAPLRTIQRCLDILQAGDTCTVLAGTYNESLTLRTSGTASQPITLKCETARACTVNSGNVQTLGTSNRTHYYTIDGLRFIGTAVTSEATLYFGQGTVWSATDETLGNDGFILRNCYIEGDVKFYGHNNLVENCELNGMGIWSNGITDGYATSHDNVYRNNLVYGYTFRGIWSTNATNNVLIEGNTIHDVVYGIDCDGAGVPVNHCSVVNNLVYNTGTTEWGAGLFLEDCFDCLIQGNIVHDIQNGTGIFLTNYGNGSSMGWHTFNNIEYRGDDSRTKILNNVIYNYPTGSGVYVYQCQRADV